MSNIGEVHSETTTSDRLNLANGGLPLIAPRVERLIERRAGRLAGCSGRIGHLPETRRRRALRVNSGRRIKLPTELKVLRVSSQEALVASGQVRVSGFDVFSRLGDGRPKRRLCVPHRL